MANLAMASCSDVSCLTALITRFLKYWHSFFISLNTSTSWAENLVVCILGRDRDPPVPVLSLMAFTFYKMLKNHLGWEKWAIT